MSLAERPRTRQTPAGIGARRRQRWMQEFRVERPGFEYRCAKLEEEPVAASVDSKDLFREASSLPGSEDLQVNFGRVLHHQRNKLAQLAQGSFFIETRVESTSRPKPDPVEIEKLLKSVTELLSALNTSSASTPSHHDTSEIASLLKQAIASLETPKATAVEPRTVLEAFDGYVDSIDGDTAYVTLESRLNGDVLYGEYSAQELLAKGIREQTSFLCETVKGGGAGRVHFAPLPKNKVTDEEARAIAEEMREAFPGDDDSVIEY